MTNGLSSREGTGQGALDARERHENMLKALGILGVSQSAVTCFDFPDNATDSIRLLHLAQSIEKTVADYKPEVIYTHHGGDLNVDHRMVHQAVMTAFRPQPGSSIQAIYSFEVPSSTGWAGTSAFPPFVPNAYADIKNYLDLKLRALEAYGPEMRAFPHARSLEAVEHRARLRGSEVGLEAAEAFVVERTYL